MYVNVAWKPPYFIGLFTVLFHYVCWWCCTRKRCQNGWQRKKRNHLVSPQSTIPILHSSRIHWIHSEWPFQSFQIDVLSWGLIDPAGSVLHDSFSPGITQQLGLLQGIQSPQHPCSLCLTNQPWPWITNHKITNTQLASANFTCFWCGLSSAILSDLEEAPCGWWHNGTRSGLCSPTDSQRQQLLPCSWGRAACKHRYS